MLYRASELSIFDPLATYCLYTFKQNVFLSTAFDFTIILGG
jgi:hypothetical protein